MHLHAASDPVQQLPVYRAGAAAEIVVDPVGSVRVVALAPDDDRGSLPSRVIVQCVIDAYVANGPISVYNYSRALVRSGRQA